MQENKTATPPDISLPPQTQGHRNIRCKGGAGTDAHAVISSALIKAAAISSTVRSGLRFHAVLPLTRVKAATISSFSYVSGKRGGVSEGCNYTLAESQGHS